MQTLSQLRPAVYGAANRYWLKRSSQKSRFSTEQFFSHPERARETTRWVAWHGAKHPHPPSPGFVPFALARVVLRLKSAGQGPRLPARICRTAGVSRVFHAQRATNSSGGKLGHLICIKVAALGSGRLGCLVFRMSQAWRSRLTSYGLPFPRPGPPAASGRQFYLCRGTLVCFDGSMAPAPSATILRSFPRHPRIGCPFHSFRCAIGVPHAALMSGA